MAGNLDRLFEDRRRRAQWGRWKGTAISATAHVVLGAAFVFLPGLLAEPKPKLEYISMVVVTPTALGIPDPPPPPPPEPVRTPPPPPPKAPPPPPKRDVPTLSTEKKPEKPRRLQQATPPPAEPERLHRRKGSALGHALGSSATRRVLGFEDPNFTYGWYLDQLVTRVMSNWTRPIVGSDIQAVFSFRIQRDGTVTDIELVEPSRLTEFDDAARRAIEASTPLASLPRGYKKSYLSINLVVK